jgi:hypothetical protein
MSDVSRAISRAAAHDVIDTARRERATLDMDSPERAYLLGVDAAAQEVLHPELGAARVDGWLDEEKPAFREGYLRTSALLAAAALQ